jgi:hypothetical protein
MTITRSRVRLVSMLRSLWLAPHRVCTSAHAALAFSSCRLRRRRPTRLPERQPSQSGRRVLARGQDPGRSHRPSLGSIGPGTDGPDPFGSGVAGTNGKRPFPPPWPSRLPRGRLSVYVAVLVASGEVRREDFAVVFSRKLGQG